MKKNFFRPQEPEKSVEKKSWKFLKYSGLTFLKGLSWIDFGIQSFGSQILEWIYSSRYQMSLKGFGPAMQADHFISLEIFDGLQ